MIYVATEGLPKYYIGYWFTEWINGGCKMRRISATENRSCLEPFSNYIEGVLYIWGPGWGLTG